VELSGATAANWVAKTANLLAAQGSPARVGMLLPLHWQAVTLLVGAVTAGATAVVAAGPGELADCDLAFVAPEHARAALDACPGDVLAVSTAPLGGRLRDLPPMVLDAGAELPAYGDVLGRPAAQGWTVELAGSAVAVPDHGLGEQDRVLTTLPPHTPAGLLSGLLAPLVAGSALVLVPGRLDPAAVAAERVTASVGADVPGARRLDTGRPQG
jgi:uncharacterized protein (TIGR03089 family)